MSRLRALAHTVPHSLDLSRYRHLVGSTLLATPSADPSSQFDAAAIAASSESATSTILAITGQSSDTADFETATQFLTPAYDIFGERVNSDNTYLWLSEAIGLDVPGSNYTITMAVADSLTPGSAHGMGGGMESGASYYASVGFNYSTGAGAWAWGVAVNSSGSGTDRIVNRFVLPGGCRMVTGTVESYDGATYKAYRTRGQVDAVAASTDLFVGPVIGFDSGAVSTTITGTFKLYSAFIPIPVLITA